MAMVMQNPAKIDLKVGKITV